MNRMLLVSILALLGCSSTTSYVGSDTTLGRVVIYRNGVAYFERYANVTEDELSLQVPADKVDDFLKSLTVVDAKSGEPAPIAYPTRAPGYASGNIDMKIQLTGPKPHNLRLTYVTEAPAWKPSYRIELRDNNRVHLQAWAIVDNTSGEDWKNVKLGVGASSALSFRYDLQSVRLVQRETLHSDDLFAQAPPTGGSTYGSYRDSGLTGKKVVTEISDDVLAYSVDELTEYSNKDVSKLGAGKHRVTVTTGSTRGASGSGARAESVPAQGNVTRSPRPAKPKEENTIVSVAKNLQNSSNQIIVEGFADKNDSDKFASSLERANRVREQLIRNGVRPDQVVAVGGGVQEGRAGGVRIVEAPPEQQKSGLNVEKTGAEIQPGEPPPSSTEPIGISHFESTSPMTVQRGTSAMISILKTDTDGEVVYLYDADSPRGNAEFPFRSVRIKNPTDSALESGPVTVFGEGRFIGEGLCEPIPAKSMAFIPFALDRQIVVERKDDVRDEISRIITVQRGVFSTEVQHIKKWTYTFHNRLTKPASVYLRHTVAQGFSLTKAPSKEERIGSAYLFRIEVPATDKVEVVLEESTPLFKSTDIRQSAGMELVKVYLSSSAAEGPLKSSVAELLKVQQEIGNLEQRVTTMREQMGEYRTRMDELHAQIVTLKAVRTAGPLMKNLEKKLEEVSDKLSKATIDLVAVQEKLMIARIRFQDGVADLSLEKKPDADKKQDGPQPATKQL